MHCELTGIDDEQTKSTALELADEAGEFPKFPDVLICCVKFIASSSNDYDILFYTFIGLELKLITKKIVENIRSQVCLFHFQQLILF